MSDEKKRVQLQIRRHASDWARAQLDFESARDDEPRLRQIAVRMPVEDVAFIDALAKRFGVSRNHAIGIFVGSAAADAYAQLSCADRSAIVEQVSETMGRPVSVRWVRDVPLSEDEADFYTAEDKEALRSKP